MIPDELINEFRNWDACPGIDPAFWQKVPETLDENDDEKPF